MILKPFQSIHNLYVQVRESFAQNIYQYGRSDNLPQQLIELISNSGEAKKCSAKVSTYTKAYGFEDDTLNKMKINDKETVEELLSSIATDVAYFKGFALNIGRDAFGKIASVKHVPFKCVRKTLKGDFLVNPTYGSGKFEKSKGLYYDSYKGPVISTGELKQQIAKYEKRGEIFYVYEETPENPIYPVPDYYSGVEDLNTSSELQKFDLESVLNGFVPSAILTIVGNIDNTTKDEAGKTAWDYKEEELEPFTGNAKNEDGLSNRGGLLVLTAATKEELPVLQSFDAKAIHESAIAKRESIGRSVCRLFGVHPVLIGFSDASILGNQQSMANASAELNINVSGYQTMIEQAFKKMFPDKTWKLTSFKPIKYIPDSVLSKLTDDEVRALYGYEPLPVEGAAEGKTLAEKLGVGGTQSLTAVISDPNLSPEQKSAALQLLFGLSEADAVKLSPTTTPPTA